MSIKTKRLMIATILRMVEFFSSALISITLMPFIISSLGDKMYGLWIFVGSFLGYYGLVDFGLTSAVQRYIARSIGANDKNEENTVINTALYIYSIMGFIVLLASAIIAYFVPFLIKHITDTETFRKLILILGINFAFGFPMRVFTGVLRAHLRFDLSSFIELIRLVVRTTLVVFFLKRGYGIMALGIITCAMDISVYIAIFFVVKRLFNYIEISRQLIAKAKIKMLFHYSVFTFIAQISDQLRFNLDNFIIVMFIGLSPVTLYSIGARLITYFSEFMMSALGITLPIFSQYEGANDYDAIKEKLFLFTKISSTLSLFIGSCLILFGKAFILRWVGQGYIDAYNILLILLIPFIFDAIQSPSTGMLFGLSKHKYYALFNSIEGISNLILSIFLVRKYGIFGVALGTAIPMLIMKILIQPVYMCKVLGIRYKVYVFNLICPCIFLAGSCLLVYTLLINQYIKPNYTTLLILIIAFAIIFFFAFYFIIFNQKERKYLNKIIRFYKK